VLFTSRPFLVTQVYTTDTATINHDDGPNDGTLLNHLDHEIDKLHSDWTHLGLPDSTRIEMHPKIAAKPFRGSWSAKFTIRPPDPGELVGLTFGEAQASFQFTCRSGVDVRVIGFDEIVGSHRVGGHRVGGHREARVEVLITSSSVGYQAPRLPPRQDFVPTRDQLEDAKGLVTLEMIAGLFNPSPLVIANIEQAVLRGVVTDAYDVPGIDLLDNSHAVPFTEVTQIPSGAGIVVDHRDVQPYPIVGFLDLRWHRPDVLGGGP
jgi:hypothetical protein